MLQLFRSTIEAFCNEACNAGQGVAVTTERYGSTNDIPKGISFQKGCYGFGYGFLAGFYMVVVRTDIVAGSAKIVMELRFNVGFDFSLAMAGSSQEDGGCGCFSTLDALGVIMGYIAEMLAMRRTVSRSLNS